MERPPKRSPICGEAEPEENIVVASEKTSKRRQKKHKDTSVPPAPPPPLVATFEEEEDEEDEENEEEEQVEEEEEQEEEEEEKEEQEEEDNGEEENAVEEGEEENEEEEEVQDEEEEEDDGYELPENAVLLGQAGDSDTYLHELYRARTTSKKDPYEIKLKVRSLINEEELEDYVEKPGVALVVPEGDELIEDDASNLAALVIRGSGERADSPITLGELIDIIEDLRQKEAVSTDSPVVFAAGKRKYDYAELPELRYDAKNKFYVLIK